MSPSARTKQFFESNGCEVVKLEHFNKWSRQTIDVWGADWLVRQGQLGMAIQATDHSHHANRVAKALDNPDVKNWMKIGLCFYVYSWGLQGAKGKRKTYTMRVTQIVLNKNDKLQVL